MAKQATVEKSGKKRERKKSSLLARVLILALLAATGWHLYNLRGQVAEAEAAQAELAAQVAAQKQENEAIAADIAEGSTQERMEEIARDELGLVSPGERVFYDVSN